MTVTLPNAPVPLADALDLVAKASFYEDLLVTPAGLSADGDPLYSVEEAEDLSLADEEWEWTYAGGTTCEASHNEVSRLHEAYEHYVTHGHIEYNMAASVAVLTERTHAVHFGYAAPDAPCECEDVDPDGCPFDHSAGWVLVARWHPINPTP